jgi:hypothetical protein
VKDQRQLDSQNMTVALRYDRPILKRAIGDYIKRVYLKKMVWMSIAAFLILVFSFSCIETPWLKAFSVVPAVTIPVMLILGYWLRVQESLKRLVLLDNGKLSLSVNESGVTVESAIGKSETKWKIYTELWEFATNYLLFYANHQFITLPKDQVNPEFIAFIRAHLKPA